MPVNYVALLYSLYSEFVKPGYWGLVRLSDRTVFYLNYLDGKHLVKSSPVNGCIDMLTVNLNLLLQLFCFNQTLLLACLLALAAS